jgi:Ca2+-binding RTX toxin-like protein
MPSPLDVVANRYASRVAGQIYPMVTVVIRNEPDATGTITTTATQADPNTANNTVTVGTGNRCTITGTTGNDTINGTGGPDIICLGGNDTISGRTGNVTIYAGTGNDTIAGGSGHTTCYVTHTDRTQQLCGHHLHRCPARIWPATISA